MEGTGIIKILIFICVGCCLLTCISAFALNLAFLQGIRDIFSFNLNLPPVGGQTTPPPPRNTTPSPPRNTTPSPFS
jgi:hypothetical protein